MSDLLQTYVSSLKILEEFDDTAEDVVEGGEVLLCPFHAWKEVGHEEIKSFHLEHFIIKEALLQQLYSYRCEVLLG